MSVVGDINGDSIDDWLFGFYNFAESEYTGTGGALVLFGTGGKPFLFLSVRLLIELDCMRYMCVYLDVCFFVVCHSCV